MSKANEEKAEAVDHPRHYGGADNPYEAIKIIEAWGLGEGFCLGNAIKYILRAGRKGDDLEDLKKAAWYVNREIARREQARALASQKLCPECHHVRNTPGMCDCACHKTDS